MISRILPTTILSMLALVAFIGVARATPSLVIDTTSAPGWTPFVIDTAGGSGAGWGIPIGTAGYVGSAGLQATEAGSFIFTYFGAGDSSNPNEFFVNGSLLFCSQDIAGVCAKTPLGTQSAIDMVAGAMDYIFLAGVGVNYVILHDGSAVGNGGSNGYPASVFTGCADSSADCTPAHPGSAVWLGLTDLPGNLTSGDDDFQDLAVLIQTPEPASLALLALGVVGLGVLGRRRGSN